MLQAIEQSSMVGLHVESMEPSVILKEKLRLTERIYEYICIAKPEYKHAGLEIVETLNQCLKSYQSDKGSFINYYMASLHRRIQQEEINDRLAMKQGGMIIPQHIKRQISQILSLAALKQWDLSNPKLHQEASTLFGITEAKVKQLLIVNHTSMVFLPYQTDQNGNEISLLKLIPSASAEYNCEDNSTETILAILADSFNSCRTSQKQVLKPLLTRMILSKTPELFPILQSYCFCDMQVCKQFQKTGTLPTSREIAKQLGKNEASVSRTLHHFLKSQNHIIKARRNNYE